MYSLAVLTFENMIIESANKECVIRREGRVVRLRRRTIHHR